MKTKHILTASLLPAFWIALAIWSVGDEREIPKNSTYTGSIVIQTAVLVIPIAVVAFIAGKDSNDY